MEDAGVVGHEKHHQELPQTFIPGFHDINVVKRMLYRPLGLTGIRVSYISLGTAQFPCYYDDDKEVKATVAEAIRRGVNYIDTAPYYGEGKAEIVLGRALRGIPRQSYYLATKVGRYTSNYETMFDFSTKGVLQKFEDSLRRLDVSYVDVIQVHDIEFAPSFGYVVSNTLFALRKLKAEGKVRFIGITGYPLSKLKEFIEASRIKVDIVLSYCRFTLFDSELKEFTPFFKERGLGVINAGVLGMSLLTSKGLPDWHPAHPTLVQQCQIAQGLCEKEKLDLSRMAVGYSLCNPHVQTTVVGMTTLEELNKNLEVAYGSLIHQEWDFVLYLKKEIFSDSKLKYDGFNFRNWEGVEVEKYRQAITENGDKS